MHSSVVRACLSKAPHVQGSEWRDAQLVYLRLSRGETGTWYFFSCLRLVSRGVWGSNRASLCSTCMCHKRCYHLPGHV